MHIPDCRRSRDRLRLRAGSGDCKRCLCRPSGEGGGCRPREYPAPSRNYGRPTVGKNCLRNLTDISRGPSAIRSPRGVPRLNREDSPFGRAREKTELRVLVGPLHLRRELDHVPALHLTDTARAASPYLPAGLVLHQNTRLQELALILANRHHLAINAHALVFLRDQSRLALSFDFVPARNAVHQAPKIISLCFADRAVAHKLADDIKRGAFLRAGFFPGALRILP